MQVLLLLVRGALAETMTKALNFIFFLQLECVDARLELLELGVGVRMRAL